MTTHPSFPNTSGQELFPPHYESSADDSSGDEGFTRELDEQWHLGETVPPEDGEFAELSNLWDDALNESKGASNTKKKWVTVTLHDKP